MNVSHSRVRLTGWLAFAVLLHAAPARADVRLDVSEIVLKNTSKVTFTVTPSDTPVDNGQLQSALPVQTDQKRFLVRIPTAVIPWWDTRQSFVYTFVVDDLETRERQVFDVLATPAGVFDEQYAPVPFTIVSGQRSDKGIATLPVASLRPERATVSFNGPKQRTLAFWGQQVLSLQVQNTSDLFPVTVQLNHTDSVEVGNSYFDGAGQIVKPSQSKVTLRPGQSVTLDVSVTPKWSSALAHLILPRGDADQANVTIKFDHQVGPFGGERATWFSEPIAVRFQPTMLDLMGALFVGALLGLAFRYINGLVTPERAARQASFVRRAAVVLQVIGVALVGAIVLEVVALFMSSAGSRLVLFGFDIDPNALLPTVIIGAIAGFMGKALGEAAQKAAGSIPILGRKASADN